MISALITVTNKSEGDFPPCIYGGGIKEAEVDAHSEYKSLLIQNYITQAPFPPLL